MPSVLLIRHAQASFGSADYDVLSPTGIEQTDLLATALARRPPKIARIAAGSMTRQRETAEPIARERGLEVELDERWNEYDTDQVIAHHATAEVSRAGTGPAGSTASRGFQGVLDGAVRAWMEAGEATPASQSWPRFRESRVAALEEFAAGLDSGETGVVFSSGGVIAAIGSHFLGRHEDLFPRLNRVAVNSAITKLVAGPSGISLISFNEHVHLDEAADGLLTYR